MTRGIFIRLSGVRHVGGHVNKRLLYIAIALFSIVAAVSAALGCPFFRNPGTYAGAGGAWAYLRSGSDLRRRK